MVLTSSARCSVDADAVANASGEDGDRGRCLSQAVEQDAKSRTGSASSSVGGRPPFWNGPLASDTGSITAEAEANANFEDQDEAQAQAVGVDRRFDPETNGYKP